MNQDPSPKGKETPDWRNLVDDLKRTRGKQFLRVSRKMLNHLVSIGLADAVDLLAEVDAAGGDPASNVPQARIALDNSLLMEGRPFELAAEYLGDAEILARLNRWMAEEKASFFNAVVGDSRSTMPEIAQAIRRYDDVLRGRSGLDPSNLRSLRVGLVQRFMTSQLDFINVAKEVVRITDFIEIINRVTMTDGCHGKLGGKASGLALAQWILGQPEVADSGFSAEVKTPRTWYIISDAIMDFIKLNQLDDVMDQKFKEIAQVRREYPNMIQLFKNSTFPPEIMTGLSRALDYFGDVPLVIRSSSLLEDRFGTTFSGKYKSLFIANQGTKMERLDALLDAVAEVWASVLGPDPIQYRRERGLVEFVEEMGIVIQEVIGSRVGKYWLPAFAGVAFSHNEFRWSHRIKRGDGLVRLVPGLGTRAVDRMGEGFPVLAVPAKPGLRANQSLEEVLRYAPRMVDVINLETGTFETVPLEVLLREAGDDYPAVDKVFSVFENGQLVQKSRFMMRPTEDDLVPNMEPLLQEGSFLAKMRWLLNTLEKYLGAAVDIEFAHDGTSFYLLQCRPQAQTEAMAPAPIPRDAPENNILFSAKQFVSNGWVPGITHIVYVDPVRYTGLGSVEEMKEIGRAVGALNAMLPKRKFILMGPGRWGSLGDIKLGVSVTYADINNTAMLIEVAKRSGDYVPDVSFGTHFFQDLVEAGIRYLPLYPDDDQVIFNEHFLTRTPNILEDLLPKYAHLGDILRVVEIESARPGHILRVYMNANLDEAMAVMEPVDGSVDEEPTTEVAEAFYEPTQYWRWRFRMAESLVLGLDHDAFGVEGIYLYGSVKDGTAGPSSDIDLLVHFHGDVSQRQQLDMYFAGWNKSLIEYNFSRHGVRVDEMLDVVYLSDADIAKGEGVARLIGQGANPARLLDRQK